jgi:hypothetical protein
VQPAWLTHWSERTTARLAVPGAIALDAPRR